MLRSLSGCVSSQLCDENNPDWAPSLKLGYETSSLGKRYKRAADRMVKKTARMDFASDIRVDDHFSEMEDYPQEGSSPEDVSPVGELTNACIEVQTNLNIRISRFYNNMKCITEGRELYFKS